MNKTDFINIVADKANITKRQSEDIINVVFDTLAEALVEGKVKKVSTCRPSKPEARQNIKDYLASTPGPDGNTVNVDL